MLYGDGLGENVAGLDTFAQAFVGGGMLVQTPNELDVLEAIALQVKLAYGVPSGVFVHPNTMSQIRLIKDKSGRPIWKDYITPDGEFKYSGLKVIETTAIPSGEFIGGDLSVVQAYNRSENVTIGLDGHDLTENKRTVVFEKRLVQFVSANDVNCLVKGDFATAKGLIEAPSA